MMLITLIVLVAYGLSGYNGYCLSIGSLKNEDGSGHSQSHSLSLGKFHQPSFRSFQESGREGGRRGGGGSRRGSERGGGGRKHLHLYGVEVPVYKFRGEDAQLECKYDPGEEPLYSVKWYKDDNEFYTYLFRKASPKKTYPIPGVIVDVQRSNERRVLLKELTFNSTGIYKCEVSADSPHFRTYDNQSIMVVVELPERGPTISGGRSHYRVGETASLNCTSSRSKPAATLTWLINENPVKSSQLVNYYPWVHEDGLESRRLGLSFTIDKSHFLKGQLTLKCQATVAAIYSAVEEEDATVSDGEPYILEKREQRFYVLSGSSQISKPEFNLPLLLLVSLHQAIT
ncbi:uncharacterized protein LOC135209024 [Macrobrachium nipponense]|uniref:uncharacterized protein LOC135209024 n=1 Tax=Macrobrachium nipponense TaxID=159736 RepID=UPI0030C862AC